MSPMHFSGRRRLIALALGLALPLAACSDDKPEGPGDPVVGDSIRGRLGDYKAFDLATIVTPVGQLGVGFAAPVNHLDKDDTTDLVARDAPDGGTFVPVIWTYDDKVFGEISRVFGEFKPLVLQLVVDGKKYDVIPPNPGAEKTVDYIAVEGTADDVSLEATYDGVTQTMNDDGEVDKGVAAALYPLADTKVKIKNCPVKDWLDNPVDFIQFTCKYTTAIPSPYVYNTWAKPGHTWLAVNVATDLQLFATGTFGESIANYSATDVKDISTIDGEKALGALQEKESEGISSGILVWDIVGKLPKTMIMKREYKLVLTGGTGKVDEPENRTVKVGGPLDLLY